MCRRPLLILIVLLWACGINSHAPAATVRMIFYPLTGEVRMQNVSAVPFEFVFYSITSPIGSLNGANGVWTSITDTYDAGGNGFIDPINHWMEFSNQSDELTEGKLLGPTPGALPASRTISLGNIWDSVAAPEPDLEVEVIQHDGLPATVIVDYSLDGDYNLDDKVDHGDYVTWKNSFGFTFAPFIDGNLNGVVDAADYTVWRDHLGDTLIGTAFASESELPGLSALSIAAAVPEPSAGLLFALAMSWLLHRYWTRCSTAR
jgi:hypothetical protein